MRHLTGRIALSGLVLCCAAAVAGGARAHARGYRSVADRVGAATGTRPRVLEFEQHGIRLIQLHDPDGNIIQLHSPLGE